MTEADSSALTIEDTAEPKIDPEENEHTAEQDKKFRVLFERANDGLVYIDWKGKIVDANQKMAELAGIRKEDFIGKSFYKLDLFDHNLLPNMLTRFKDTFIGKETSNYQMTLKRKDGTEKTVEVNASIIHQKRRLGLLAIVRDVTERKQAMEALVESEEKYHSLFENMLNGFAYCKIILDSAGKPVDFVYLEVNDAFETLTGLKKEDVIGKKVTEVIPGIKEAHPELFEIYGRVAITGKHEKFEIHFAPFDMWLSILVYSTKKEHFAAVFENITEEKKLKQIIAEYSRGLEFTVTEKQRELEETQNRLAEAGRLAAIGELAGMIGHDLRNPLTAMKNAAYYLQTKGPICSDDKKDTMLQVINSSVDHANKIINDLLDYSRRMQLEFQECSPTSLATQALALANVPNRITVINNLQEKPSFYVDKDKMLRVFVNLIKNAVDAMPNQGTLHISSKQKGHKIELVFSDTGTGIPNEIKSKMFTPLLTTKAQGMGFGLAICKRIVDAHGGEIYAESGNGKGARFIITLPILPKTQL